MNDPANSTKEKDTLANLNINASNAAIKLPYPITPSKYPINNTFNIHIPLQGTHHILGMILKIDTNINKIQLKEYKSRIPAIRILKWRLTLRNKYVSHMNSNNYVYI